MRNTTCINAFCAALLATATPVAAQDVPLGCFARTYTADHLAAHPQQIVERLTLNFYPSSTEADLTFAHITAQIASTGRAVEEGIAGLTMTEVAGNFRSPTAFAVECDGGSFFITRLLADSLRIESSFMRVGIGGCGAEADQFTSLGEGGQDMTSYVLYRADPTHCEAS